MAKIHPRTANWKMFLTAVAVFLLVEGFGVLSARSLELSIRPTDIFVFLSVFDVLPEVIIAVAFGAFVIAALYFLRNRKYVLKAFFSLFVLAGASFIFQIYLEFYLGVALSFAVVVLWLAYKKVWVHDLAVALVICGLGVNFGQIIPIQFILVIMAVLCIYDFYAVIRTRVLVKIFSGLASGGLVLAFIIPSRLKNFARPYDRVDADENFFYLGTGDLLLPLMLAAAAVPSSLAAAALAALGAVFGFAALYFYMHFFEIRRPMPALPPIALFSVLGFAIGVLIG